jgi:hypothetical protein
MRKPRPLLGSGAAVFETGQNLPVRWRRRNCTTVMPSLHIVFHAFARDDESRFEGFAIAPGRPPASLHWSRGDLFLNDTCRQAPRFPALLDLARKHGRPVEMDSLSPSERSAARKVMDAARIEQARAALLEGGQ